MPQIRPITDLRKTTELSELCHASKEPIFITKNGYGDLVVMSMETYEGIVSDREIDAAIMQAEAEFSQKPMVLDARLALPALRRKYFEKR
ncbi:MAG: prevent-host-death protein [Clostridia bacterium]|nr:prevent-host-death protein [Clostridia bacterium]